jgi:hypothetical protein
VERYLFEEKLFEIGHLPVEGDMWQFSSCFEWRSVGDDVVTNVLLEVGSGKVLFLLGNPVI